MLFNHEGEKRGETFVTRKITKGVSNIKKGLQQFITLGNINTYRDWGYCKDYCKAIITMLEVETPDDYTVATGEVHNIREFIEEAFRYIGINIIWKGEGLLEVGYDQNGIIRVNISKEFYRPAEVTYLCGDYSKIKEKLGWEPKTKFKKLVQIMMENDLK